MGNVVMNPCSRCLISTSKQTTPTIIGTLSQSGNGLLWPCSIRADWPYATAAANASSTTAEIQNERAVVGMRGSETALAPQYRQAAIVIASSMGRRSGEQSHVQSAHSFTWSVSLSSSSAELVQAAKATCQSTPLFTGLDACYSSW
jgi:hypothetical protein